MSAPYTELANGVWRLELPSRTLPPFGHTNSYLVQDRGVGVLVDPGFHEQESWSKVRALLDATDTRLLKAVLLTHTHPDHVAGLGFVQTALPDVPVYVHPNEHSRLEGLDPGGKVAQNLQALNEGRTLTVGNKTVRSVFTPGHSPGHLSFFLEDEALALVGDMAANEGSTWIGLPEGDVDDYLASLDTLRSLNVTVLGPGHGEPIPDPYTRLNELRQHRLDRLEQVYRALEAKELSLEALRQKVYPDLHEGLNDLAVRSLLALLKKLMGDMRVLHLGKDAAGPYAQRR